MRKEGLELATILGFVSDLATTIFSIGSSLITWITATGHEIVLIPIVAWLVVLAIGAIRKLIKGV